MKFSDLPLNESLLEGIDSIGFESLTPVQEATIPLILEDHDLIACAQTGTGKTAAFLLPIIHKLTLFPPGETRCLIITPTRELAEQIDQNVEALGYFTDVSSVPIIGGKNASKFDQQKAAITSGADILVATPGRLKIHLALGYVDFSQIEFLILDEADKMLDMGFFDDIMQIVSHLPEERQTLLFSATMPPKIRKLASKILNKPKEVSLSIAKPAEGISQLAFSVFDDQKVPLLTHLIKERDVESMIIFASSKISVDQITRKLKKLKYEVAAIHSDKSQDERQETLRAFKNKQFKILVGTDVLARGIDIDNLSHVLNYDVPLDAEDYVHRIGRTARASNTGEAITFINPADQYKFSSIEELIEMEVPKPDLPPELGDAPVYRPRGGRRRGHDGGRRQNNRNGRNRNNRNNNGRRRYGNSGGGGQNRNRNNRSRKPNGNKARQDQGQQQEGRDKEQSNNAKKKRNRNRRRRPKRNNADPGNPSTGAS